MSHFLRDGVQAYLPGHLTFNAMSAEILSGSEMELVRGRTHPVLPVGLRVICLFPALTQDLKIVWMILIQDSDLGIIAFAARLGGL